MTKPKLKAKVREICNFSKRELNIFACDLSISLLDHKYKRILNMAIDLRQLELEEVSVSPLLVMSEIDTVS